MAKGTTLNTVTGVVALSYLVVLPVAGYVGYVMLRELKQDMDELWAHFEGGEPPERPDSFVRRYLLK